MSNNKEILEDIRECIDCNKSDIEKLEQIYTLMKKVTWRECDYDLVKVNYSGSYVKKPRNRPKPIERR